MGPTGCGKSNVRIPDLSPKDISWCIVTQPVQFIDHVTKSTKWSSASLKLVTQDVRAIRIPLFGENIVLVDTPGFDDTYRSDVTILELIGDWLKKT